ncbi:conserved oligomeric Golgi complex subunit 2-like [Xenia sp. Carnegie-2017]|uniref:conserved oligomeric Golgi complex subunit 2-like n=1 Tax=Xenia sp. Carnegie-2017 TaxID=2897299 RepID=UPI001F04FD3D|nr:conserved oligomeric Golgi complex subunit 2-like [Xenia sp. Carnegie-2017]
MGESEREIMVEPNSSCFTKNDFMQDDFQVDKFVSNCKKIVPLNVFKKQLDDYMRLLKNALIELINQDYADFVNLSTDLVGMDKAINNLTVPLGQLREEILSIQSDLDITIRSVETKLKQRAELREKKVFTQNLLNITHCMEKIERVLKTSVTTDESTDSSEQGGGHLIERVASDFNQLQFYVTQCQGHPMVEKIRSRISEITSTLQKNLETSFQEGYKQGDIKVLTQCLRTYAIIDKISFAENLFQSFAVKPYMKIINEQSLKANGNGLLGMYKDILAFIPNYCGKLIDITLGKTLSAHDVLNVNESMQSITGYNFIINSVWPEISSALQNNLTSIFAAGDPVIFHKNYTTSMNFLREFEKYCRSKENILKLRSHPSYVSFISRWSLPIYFQIRFKEIAGSFESSMLNQCSVNQEENGLCINVIQEFWKSFERCWDEKVFLFALSHRFWKLTLQLISRLAEWLKSLKLREQINATNKKPPSASLPASSEGDLETSTSSHVTMTILLHVVADVMEILKKIPHFWEHTVLKKLPDISRKEKDNLNDILLNKRCSQLQETLPYISSLIVQNVTTLCCNFLDGAKNIPRLYRRTNREAPLKPSSYINNVIEPLKTFMTENETIVSAERLQEWLLMISENVAAKFYNLTSEVLTSIKRTEDSLLRLKRIRKNDIATANVSITEGDKITDDDKIRMQFALDTEEFGKQISLLGISVKEVASYKQLSAFVENAKNTSNSYTST